MDDVRMDDIRLVAFAVRLAGVTQLVECNLAKVDVAGSNPVSRSNFPEHLLFHLGLGTFARPSCVLI